MKKIAKGIGAAFVLFVLAALAVIFAPIIGILLGAIIGLLVAAAVVGVVVLALWFAAAAFAGNKV